jgi:hypothetical protein
MLFLTWIWGLTESTVVGGSTYDSYSIPFFPALEYENGAWTTRKFSTTNARQQDFLRFDNYRFASLTKSYNVATDQSGPLYFFPKQCLASSSIVDPQV